MCKKNKILLYALIFALIISPLSISGEDTVYSGTPSGEALIKNGTYTDIGGSPYAEDIMKMSAYSIVREYGANIYRPNQAAAKQDILAALVRAIGRQEDAVRQGAGLKAANPSLSPVDQYIMGHMEVAKASGIIRQSEIDAVSALTPEEKDQIKAEADKEKKANWKMTKAQYDQLIRRLTDEKSFRKAYRSPVNREEAALWIARALKFQPVTGEEIKNVYNYKDWNTIKTENLPYVEEILRRNIMAGKSGSFQPRGNITRGEMAAIMNAVSEQSLTALGFTKGFGTVSEVVRAGDFQMPADTYTTRIIIETPASGAVNINVRKKSGLDISSQEAVPVIKNGKIGNEGLVAEGDIVEYTINKDDEVLLLHVAKLKEIDGIFDFYDPRQNTVQMTDRSNNIHNLKVMPDSVVKAQKEPVDIGRIEPGSSAKAIYAGNMLKSLVVEIPAEVISGTELAVRILYADTLGRVIKVADQYENKELYELSDNAAIYINGDLQGIEAIGFDQDAVIRLLNGKIYEVSIITDIQEEDPYRDIVFIAGVRDISSKGITLVKDNGSGKEELYTIDANAPVIKNRISVSAGVLRQGDRVKVYLNTSNDRHITKLEVQGEGLLVEKVYKGDIKDVNYETGELILSNVYSYGYYGWVKKGDYIRYKLSWDSAFYRSGIEVSRGVLRDSIGKTLYAASRKNYGTEEIVKAVFKEGYEDTSTKDITGVKWTTRQMSLSDGRTVGFSDGTIIIKDGRLLDTAFLEDSPSAFIVQNKSLSGTSTAPVISLGGFEELSTYRITKGYLYEIGKDYYNIDNSYVLDSNYWSQANEGTFLFSSETSIFDYVFEKAEISREDFVAGGYKPYKYSWPNYKTAGKGQDYHELDEYHYNYERYRSNSKFHEHILTYTISDGDGNAQGVYLYKKDKLSYKPDPVFTERITIGTFKTADIANKQIIITDAKVYSAANTKWDPVMANMPVNTEKAFVFKNGKRIGLDELSTTDNLYIVSQDDFALLIIVE